MATLPDTVQIGPFRYTIHASDRRTSRNRAEYSAPDRAGMISYVDQTIDVDPSLAHDQQAVVLLHEVLHGVWAYGNLPRGDESTDGNDAKDEKARPLTVELALDSIDAPLLDTLRRNPALVAFLVADQG